MVSIASSVPLPLIAPRELSSSPRFDDGDHADFSSELAAAGQRAETPDAAQTPVRKPGANPKIGSDLKTKAAGSSSSNLRTRRTDPAEQDRTEQADDPTKATAPTAAPAEKPIAEQPKTSSGALALTSEPEQAEQKASSQAEPAPDNAISLSPAEQSLAGTDIAASFAVQPKAPAVTPEPKNPKPADAAVPPQTVQPDAEPAPAPTPEVVTAPQVAQVVTADKTAVPSSLAAAFKGRASKQPEADRKQEAANNRPAQVPAAAPQPAPAPATEIPKITAENTDAAKPAQTNVSVPDAVSVKGSATGSPKIETAKSVKSDDSLAFAVTLTDRQDQNGAAASKTPAASSAAKQPAGFTSELPPPSRPAAATPAPESTTANLPAQPQAASAQPAAPAAKTAADIAPAQPRVTISNPAKDESSTEDKPADAKTAAPQASTAPAPAIATPVQPAAAATPAVHAAEVHEAPAPAAAPETQATPAAQRPAEPLRDISVRIGSNGDSRVDVRLTDRAGELRIEVRTPDAHLNKSLRDGLPELAERLETAGRTNQVWRPADSGASLTDHGSRESQNQAWSSQSQNQSRQNQQSGSDAGRRGRQNPQDEPDGGQEQSFAAYLRQGRGNR